MDTSVTIIGIIIIIIIGIPLYFVFRSNVVNRKKINQLFEQYSQNNYYNFSQHEIQNKKILAIDEIKKGLLLIDLNETNENVLFLDLKKVTNCKLLFTKTNTNDTIEKIEFQFQFKESDKKKCFAFYRIEKDQIGQVCLYEDHQLAKKWETIIQNCISR
ncbi:hypothetical protein [Flavobacterium psychrotolerans]|uniref:Transmembrane protein n=1 Tax=Flavobacterium psychrotolerans TaxID=2169410 RepID=A0A2U1JMK7_9FLAO|nr:hypothetical protein [Flavobacterium psychrotolerans]PWA06113.1 hypothetical protein DB895_04210 [Flavobacterium psychrotolerans]